MAFTVKTIWRLDIDQLGWQVKDTEAEAIALAEYMTSQNAGPIDVYPVTRYSHVEE